MDFCLQIPKIESKTKWTYDGFFAPQKAKPLPSWVEKWETTKEGVKCSFPLKWGVDEFEYFFNLQKIVKLCKNMHLGF